ncbi:MAG: HAD family hydrolase, partial [Planctomycetota bacterium]
MSLLVLFDIDGTLLLSSRQGARAMQEAGQEVVGEDFTLAGVEFAGRLDPLILADGLRALGLDGVDSIESAFREAYARILARRLAEPGTAYALAGVPALLARLRSRPGTTLGLLTGNYPETGTLKLQAAGLDPTTFEIPVWGTDGATRRDLPPVALRRFLER